MKRDVIGFPPRVAEDAEHAGGAGVVERVDEDDGVALRRRVVGEPAGDGVAGALVVRLVREVVFLHQVVVEEHGAVVPLAEPADGRQHVAGHVQVAAAQVLAEPRAARLVVLHDQNALLSRQPANPPRETDSTTRPAVVEFITRFSRPPTNPARSWLSY